MKRFIYIIILSLFASCTSYKRCYDKFGELSKDTVFIEVLDTVPVQVEIPADSLSVSIKIDSLEDGIVYSNSSDSSSLLLEYYMDEYNKLLHVKARQPPKVVFDTVIISDSIPCPPQVVFNEPQKKLISTLDKLVITLVLIIIILFLWRKLFT